MSTPAPGSALAGDASTELAALVTRMREADIPPSVEELADALWLARWLPAPTEPFEAASCGATRDVRGPDGNAVSGTLGAPAPEVRIEGEDDSQESQSARLFAPGVGGEGTRARMESVRVPAAPALPDPLAMQRALRPLQRYRAPVRPVPRVLDERATAEQAAESGLVLPVLRAERRREARLLLLMDVSTSTVVWQQALDELRQVCERAGAFREVRVQYLHATEGGLPRCSATVERGGELHAPEQLSDPTGRLLTLVLSDCAGPMWRNGRMQRLLHGWAKTAPVAVVQPLPQRMWLRTHLPARRGLLHRREGPAGQLEFEPAQGRAERGATPLPVLALRRSSVESWARLVAGSTGQSLAAAAGWVRADHAPSTAPVRAAEDISGAERVRAFWRPASKEARRLAVYLSAVPLYLPVMQLVQHAMLAGSGPDVLSEVLLSGLLKRREDATDPQEVRYDFLPGAATELRAHLTVDDFELLFKHCSEYVQRRFGRSARNFPALAGASLQGALASGAGLATTPLPEQGEEPAGLRAFAEVSADVLRDLGQRRALLVPPAVRTPDSTELLRRAEETLKRFREEGLTRELDQAVDLFHQASAANPTAEVQDQIAEGLAGSLLARWQVRQAGGDLRDALEAVADRSFTTVRILRGLILYGLSEEVAMAGFDSSAIPDGICDWARSRATEEHPAGLWARCELLRRACEDLAGGLNTATTDVFQGIRRRTATDLLPLLWMVLARQGSKLARPKGHFDADTPQAWYVDHMMRAVDAVRPGLDLPQPERGLLTRGRALLALARYYAGEGEVELLGHVDRALVATTATDAAEDLTAAVRSQSALPADERCRGWLDAASAVNVIRSPDRDGAERELIDHALKQALSIAGTDRGLLFQCHARTARLYRKRHEELGHESALDRVLAAWQIAVPLLPGDDPQRAGVFTEYGDALFIRGRASRDPEVLDRCVRALRAAVDETEEGKPVLSSRRMALGIAHALRYEDGQVLSDLYEAEWLLGEAARGLEPERAAYAWNMRGLVAVELFNRTDTVRHLHKATDYYRVAAANALESGKPTVYARARYDRAGILERLDEPDRALREYHEALQPIRSTGSSPADDIREAIARLESAQAEAGDA